MSKSSYLLILISSLGNMPFNGAMASDATISFYLEYVDKINEKSYDGIINRLRKAGLCPSTDDNKEYLKIKKSDLIGNDTSNKISVKELTDKLCSKISKTYSWSGIWTIEIEIYRKMPGDQLNLINKGAIIDLGTEELAIEFKEIKRNDTVAIAEMLFIVVLISVGLIYYYLYFFKQPVKEASSEQKINEEASLEKPTVQEEVQEKKTLQEKELSEEEVSKSDEPSVVD